MGSRHQEEDQDHRQDHHLFQDQEGGPVLHLFVQAEITVQREEGIRDHHRVVLGTNDDPAVRVLGQDRQGVIHRLHAEDR